MSQRETDKSIWSIKALYFIHTSALLRLCEEMFHAETQSR